MAGNEDKIESKGEAKLTMRRTSACESLRSSLIALMLEKPFASIGVKELCAHAHVSRSTFYAYYGNTDELLCEVEDAHVGAIDSLNAPVADPSVAGVDAMGFYNATLAYLRDHADGLRALLVANPQARFASKWKAAIKAHLRERMAQAGRPVRSEFAMELAASAVVSACAYLLDDPRSASDAEVRSVLSKALEAIDS